MATGINFRRVILGGLVLGVLLNITESFLNLSLLARETEASLKVLNLPPISGGAIAFYVTWGFVQGFVTVWLYAAIRPRLGPGPVTAVAAGGTVWLLAYALPGLGNAFTHVAPWGLTIKVLLWTLVEAPLAALVGARLYREA